MNYMDVLPVVSLLKNGKQKAFRNILSRANIKKDVIDNTLLYYQYVMRDGDTLDSMAARYYGTPARFWMFLYGNEKMDAQWDFGMDTSVFLPYLREKYCYTEHFADYLIEKLADVEGIGEAEIEERINEKSDEDVLQYCLDSVMYYYKVITKYDPATENTVINEFVVDKKEYFQDKVDIENITFYKAKANDSYFEAMGIESSVKYYTYPEQVWEDVHKDGEQLPYLVYPPEIIKSTITTSYKFESIYDYELRINQEKRHMNVIKDSYAEDMERQVEDLLGE